MGQHVEVEEHRYDELRRSGHRTPVPSRSTTGGTAGTIERPAARELVSRRQRNKVLDAQTIEDLLLGDQPASRLRDDHEVGGDSRGTPVGHAEVLGRRGHDARHIWMWVELAEGFAMIRSFDEEGPPAVDLDVQGLDVQGIDGV